MLQKSYNVKDNEKHISGTVPLTGLAPKINGSVLGGDSSSPVSNDVVISRLKDI